MRVGGEHHLHTFEHEGEQHPVVLGTGDRLAVTAVHEGAAVRPLHLAFDGYNGEGHVALHLPDLFGESTVQNAGDEVLDFFALHPPPLVVGTPDDVAPVLLGKVGHLVGQAGEGGVPFARGDKDGGLVSCSHASHILRLCT